MILGEDYTQENGDDDIGEKEEELLSDKNSDDERLMFISFQILST